jgi:hypothetical protein
LPVETCLGEKHVVGPFEQIQDAQIMTFEDRLRELFAHLGVERAHIVGGGYYSPAGDIPVRAPDLAVSMTLVCPMSVPQTIDNDITLPFAIVTGDRGGLADSVANALQDVVHGHQIVLNDCAPELWDDLARERTRELGDGILNFLASVDEEIPLAANHLGENGGMVAELAYRTMGDGPPLVLFPLGLAPSQWRRCSATRPGSPKSSKFGKVTPMPCRLPMAPSTLLFRSPCSKRWKPIALLPRWCG